MIDFFKKARKMAGKIMPDNYKIKKSKLNSQLKNMLIGQK